MIGKLVRLLKRYKFIILFILISILSLKIIFLDRSSFLSVLKSQYKKKNLIEQNTKLVEKNKILIEENKKLKMDLELLEKRAREKYGLQKKGETVIQFLPEDSN